MADLATITKVRVVEWKETLSLPAGEALGEGSVIRIDATSLKAMLGNASAAAEARLVGLNTKAITVVNKTAVILKKGLVALYDTTGANVLASMNPGDKVYGSASDSKLANASPLVNAKQTVTLTDATGGTFTLTFGGQTTAAIAYNAAASAVQTALQALSTIGQYNVVVSGNAGGPWTVEFVNGLGKQPVATMTGTWTSLTGTGATGAVAVAVAGVLEVVIGKVVVLWDDPTTPTKLLSVDL